MSNNLTVALSRISFIFFWNKAWSLYWFYHQEKDIYTILVLKLQKLYGPTANKNMDMVEVLFLKFLNIL